MDITKTIGRKIHELRLARGLTLQNIADKAGCTAAYISLIENDKASPSIASLKRIPDVLNVRIVDFFSEDEEGKEPVVMKKDEWNQVSLKGWRADIRQMVKTTDQKHMQPFYTIIEPNGGTSEPYTHVGQEFGLVLSGELTLTVGDKTYKVTPESSFFYSSLTPHSWINEGDVPCCVVWVVSPPTW